MAEVVQAGTVNLKILYKFQEDGLPLDISAATTKTLYIKPPNAALQTKTAEFESDGSDGQIYYQTALPTEVNAAGQWRVQGYVEMPGFTGRGSIASFEVATNLS